MKQALVRSLLWLRRLSRPRGPWWGPLLCAVAVLCGLGLGFWVRHLRASQYQAQRAQLEQLSPREAQTLLRQMQRWERMSPDQQQRLLRLHRQLEADPQRQELLQAMEQFHRWLTQVPLHVQYSMLKADSSPEKRLEQFRHLYLEWTASRRLSLQEREALVAWWRKQLLRHRRLDPKKLTSPRGTEAPAAGDRPSRRPPPERRLLELLRIGVVNRSREAFFPRLRAFLESLPEEAFDELEQSWPKETAPLWQFARTVEEKQMLVRRWTVGVLYRLRLRVAHPRGSEQEIDRLARRFAELPPAVQARLLELPPEQFFSALRRATQEDGPPRRPGPGRFFPRPRALPRR